MTSQSSEQGKKNVQPRSIPQLRGKVAAILNEDKLVLNIGSQAGVKEGTRFNIFGSREVTDPDTGKVLGQVAYQKLNVVVTQVQAQLCTATPTTEYDSDIYRILTQNVFSGGVFGGRRKKIRQDKGPSLSSNEFVDVSVGDIAEGE
ncbi:MAG: FlgT C-terminal domain-containing protein [Dehalococcoidia bacterium]|nr:FlgT C-terminal domain-containing protein [Dehalococcoidia bacterium]